MFTVNHGMRHLKRDAVAGDVEAAFVADMLVDTGERRGNRKILWTCRHHDTETGRCLVYHGRPEMCREYKHPCSREECGVPFQA